MYFVCKFLFIFIYFIFFFFFKPMSESRILLDHLNSRKQIERSHIASAILPRLNGQPNNLVARKPGWFIRRISVEHRLISAISLRHTIFVFVPSDHSTGMNGRLEVG